MKINMNQQEAREDQIRKSAVREGIRMERERVIRLLMSQQYRHAPSEDAAMVIHNGIHWGPDYE